MALNPSFLNDVDSFGPAMPGRFDFTPFFEDTFLSIIPSALLLVILPFRIISLYKQTRKVSGGFLHRCKLAFLGAFIVLQIALLVSQVLEHNAIRSRATIAATSLTFLVALSLCFLSHIEHSKSVRPSAIISTYLLFTLLFDIARLRTLFLSGTAVSITATFSISVAVKVIIIAIEGFGKRNLLLPPYQALSPEATSGICSRTLFWWLNGLMRTGYGRILSNDDLYPIDNDMASRRLRDQATDVWTKTDHSKPNALLWVIFKSCRAQLVSGFLPRASVIGFKYAQPFILFRIVDYISTSSDSDSDETGWGLTGAFILVLFALAVSTSIYDRMVFRFMTMTRGTLVSMIYKRTVEVSITALNESGAITMMSSDTETVCQSFRNLHELWAVPIELAIALYLLQRQLGIAFVAPTVVAIISACGTLVLAKSVGKAQKIWMQGIQTRVDFTTVMLGSMKALKMLGFTDIITTIVQSLRVEEVSFSSLLRELLCYRFYFATSTSIFSPLLTFIVFVATAKFTGEELTAASAYTALSLLYLITTPISTAVKCIPEIKGAMASLSRIQAYLTSDSCNDYLPTTTDFDSEKIEKANVIDPSFDASAVMVHVQNASFGWKAGSEFTISDITFVVPRSHFCFIIGPVGSGKSTLVKGLLGETPSRKGHISRSTRDIGFVDQTPWIQNMTLKENIIGTSSFDSEWYSQVVLACALEQDINILPDRDASLVGSKGISLSGGQKQRVGIARALYARKELVILDDVFSGQDADTEENIFRRLLGRQGLFRKLGTTVLLVTHAVERLPYSDHIIALDINGHINEQGSFTALRDAGGYVQSLRTRGRIEDNLNKHDAADPLMGKLETAPKSEKSKTDITSSTRHHGEFASYKYYFGSVGWMSTIGYFTYMMGYAATSKITELLVTFWTDDVADKGNHVNGFYIGIYSMIIGLSAVTVFFAIRHLMLHMVPKSARVLHARLLHTVMEAPLSFSTTNDTGKTTNRFSQDLMLVDTEIPYSLLNCTFGFNESIMCAILMCLSAGYFAATIPFILFAVWVLQKYYLRTSRQIRLLEIESKAPLYSHFIESLSGLTTIRAFGWSETFVEQNLSLLDVSQKSYYLLFCIQRWLALVLDMMTVALALVLMVLIMRLRRSVSAGNPGLALLNIMSFSGQLSQFIKSWTGLETAIGAISRLKQLSEQTPSENLPGENQRAPADWPSKGGIEFDNVSSSYKLEGDLVVRNITLSVKAGEKIGICGRSGSGKSSLIASLFQMMELRPGSSIRIDGIDISTLPRQTVRSRLNAISQDPFFIKGTVRFNLDPYQRHKDSEIIASLQKVSLWDVVVKKGGGLNADLDAEFFSHGQRQLFCLARAIMKESKIVVLDEVTSSVDKATDELMQRIIRDEFRDCTVLAIAHRLDSILDFDKIALLSVGELVEFDEPKALLARDSAFSRLYHS